MRFRLVFIFILLSVLTQAQEQPARIIQPPHKEEQASIGPRKVKHSPTKAAWLSAVLPGAGQIYNHKSWWWKVPIIYGGGTGLIYGFVFYQQGYDDFRNAYKYRIQTGALTNGDARYDRFQTPTLKLIRDSYRQARDQCGLGIFLLYTLQILDATVEAHLLEFNINDDLSLKVQPVLIPYDRFACTGIQFGFTIK